MIKKYQPISRQKKLLEDLFDHEMEKFWLYWSERKLDNAKLALLHWMDKARRDKVKEADRERTGATRA